MISFNNQRFHEKIMKKYGKIIRKSYFPNLFFKRDFRSSGQKIHVFARVKFAFHNALFLKNFLLSPPEEKTHGTSGFALKLKISGLKLLKQANEENISLNPGPVKHEPQNLTYRFMFPKLPSSDFKYPESTTSGFISLNFEPARLINQKLTVYYLQPSNLKSLNPDTFKLRYLNYFSAGSSSQYLNILKINVFKNNNKVLISKIRNRIQIPQNDENSFLKGSSLFFAQPRLPVVHKISFQKSEFFKSSPACLLFPPLTVRSLIQEFFNGILRKSKELKHSDHYISGGDVFTIGSCTGVADSINFEILLEPLSNHFNLKRLKRKTEERKKAVESIQRRQYLGVDFSSKERITGKKISGKLSKNLFMLQKSFLKGDTQGFHELYIQKGLRDYKRSISYESKNSKHTLTREFNWLTTLKHSTSVVSQLNRQEINKPKNKASTQHFHAVAQPVLKVINSEKVRSFYDILRHLKAPKFTSELTRMTRILTENYQLSDLRTEYAVYFQIAGSQATKYTTDFQLSDPYAPSPYAPSPYAPSLYAPSSCTSHCQKVDSKIELNKKKYSFIQIHRIKSTLNQHLFFNPLRIIECRSKWAKAILSNYEKNIFQKAIFASESLTHPLIPVLVEIGLSHKIQNELLKKIEYPQLPDRDFLFLENAPTKRSGSENTGFRTSDKLLKPLSRLFTLNNLKRKAGINKEAVKSIQRRKPSGIEPSNLIIWKKQNLIERNADQEYKELLAFRRIQNMSLNLSVQFLIQKFLENNSFFLDYEYLADPENTETGQNIVHQQRKVVFPYSKKKVRKILSTDRMFSVKETVSGNKIPGKFNKNLFILQRAFLKRDTPSFPDLYIQQLTSKLITLIRSPLLVSNNGILSAGVSSHGAASKSGDHKSKRSMGHERSKRIFISWLTNVFQQYPQTVFEAMTGIFEKMFAPSIVEQNKNLRYVLKLSSCRCLEPKIPESTVTHIFKCLTDLTYNISAGFQQNGQEFQLNRLRIILGSRAVSPLNRQEIHKPENVFFTPSSHVDIKPASRESLSIFNIHRALLTRNKPTQTIGTYTTEIHTTDSPANIEQEKKYHSLCTWLQKTFKFPEALPPSSMTTVKGENPAYPQKIPVLREYDSISTYTLKRSMIHLHDLTKARIFNNHVTLKSDFTKEYTLDYLTFNAIGRDIHPHLQQAFHTLNYAGTHTFSEINRHLKDQKSSSKVIHTTNYPKDDYHLFDYHKIAHDAAENQKIKNKRDRKREKPYSDQTIQINKLQNKFIQHVFLKSLNTVVYRLKKLDKILYNSTQNFVFNDTATPIFGLKEAYKGPQQNHKSKITSVYKGIHPVKRTLSYSAPSTQSYPAFFTSFSALHNKDILEYSRILYSPSGMGTPTATEYLSILSKTQNLIHSGAFSSNGIFSGSHSKDSVPLPFGTGGTASRKKTTSLFSLSKYTSSIISQHSVFSRKSEVSSNTEIGSSNVESLRYKSASISHLNEEQKLNGQKFSHRRKARMNLSLGGGKIVYSNTGNFLKRSSVNSLKRENNNQQANKKIDTPSELQMIRRFFSDFVLSTRNDFRMEMKRKKIFSTTPNPENKPENMYDIFNRFLFRSKIPNYSEKAARSRISRIHLGSESTYFAFPRTGEAGKASEITAFWTSGKERSELMHAERSNHKTGREDLVYGTSETLLEEVKKIKKIIFETKEAVADHFESHMQQTTGKAGQVIDVENMSEKIMKMINHNLKIEAERRGIF